MRTVNRHISQIRPGDTVICNDGEARTIGATDIKRDACMGITLRGDSHYLGLHLIKVVVYPQDCKETKIC